MKKEFKVLVLILLGIMILILIFILLIIKKCNLETDKIIINKISIIEESYVEKGYIEITDKEAIKEIVKLCDNGFFRINDTACNCITEYEIDFNNGIELHIHRHSQGGPAGLYINGELLFTSVKGELYQYLNELFKKDESTN